jgi:Flp pilus assembly protein CpaB
MGAGRGRRTGLILIVVIILLLLVGVVAIFALNSLAPAPSTGGGGAGQPTQAPKPTTIKLIVAAHDIRRGTRLAEKDVITMDWPILKDVPAPKNTIVVGDTPDLPGLEQVNDRVARVDILAGQLVLTQMLTPPNQPPQLAAGGSDAALTIPQGMVAIAFPLNRMSSVAYALQIGDHVDVLMSFRFVDLDKDFQTRLPNAITTFTGGTAFPTSPTDSTLIGMVTQGKEDKGGLGVQALIIPGELDQRPRQTTQLVIANVIVMHLGDWPLNGEEQSVVVTAAAEQAGTPAAPAPTAAVGAAPTAAPVLPDIITLVMSRQDALVLKYSLEIGADIDFALRSAYDNDVKDVKTDSVTLDYIFNTYNVAQPPKLPIGFEPSIDIVVNPTGQFQQGVSAAPAK